MNQRWHEVFVVQGDEVVQVKTAFAYHTAGRYVTILGIEADDRTTVVYQDGTPDINKPVRVCHYSWFARGKD
jgi:hypothetical protein